MFVEVRDKDRIGNKPIAEAQASVSLFLSQLGVISVPLLCDNEKIGEIRFETFDEEPTEEHEIDPNYPHVKPRCVVCKDTHRNDRGTPY